MNIKAIGCVVGALFPLVAISPASAEDFAVLVPHGDIDLTNSSGQRVLQERIRSAIAAVCERPSARELKSSQDWQICVSRANDQAHEQFVQVLAKRAVLELAQGHSGPVGMRAPVR